MSTKQPTWKLLRNIGGVDPIGAMDAGHLVYEDTTGVYGHESEVVVPIDDDGREEWIVYRFGLDKCTYENGVLSDNQFHKDHAAWFAKPESERANRPQDTTYLSGVAECTGISVEELIEAFCSDDPIARAFAYEQIGHYHGFENLDNYPLRLTREEAEKRYADIY